MTVFLIAALLAAGDAPPAKFDKSKLEEILTESLDKHKVPALGAIVLTPNGDVAAVVGFRKKGDDTKATVADEWHLGSDSKAMTATLLAILVHKKLVRYDSTMAEVFPDLQEMMHDDFKTVTLDQLLRHRAGLPANLSVFWQLFSPKGPIREQRQRATATLLAKKPELPPGTKFQYSNAGYTIAGHVAERVGKASWEELMKQHIFDPLEMKSAGFGAAGSPGKVDQPWPHTAGGKPVEPGPKADNPELIGPAGRIHCSLGDWAKFVREVMKGAGGKDGLLPAAAYRKLVEPTKGEQYTAGGWGRIDSPNGYMLAHDGSNTMNYCSAAVFPEKGIAVLIVCNQGGKEATEATRDVRKALVAALLKKKE